jgi:orotate phosphoribosyltransferase-like protein
VLRLIAPGNANKEIADQLSLAEDTVKWRVKNILSKLGARDRTQAAMIGVKRGHHRIGRPPPHFHAPPKIVAQSTLVGVFDI